MQRHIYEMMRIIALILTSAPLVGQVAFEVASIKSAPPQEMGYLSVHTSIDKGRLSAQNVSLMYLITTAYRVQPRQVSGPDWLELQRFDISAKFPDGVDEKQVPEMLQALLADRFALKLHTDTKELPIYALVTNKNGSKLLKADEATGINSSGHNAKMQVSAKTTLADFAGYLSRQMDRPVVDQTGLEGAYSIELDWSKDTVDAPNSDSSGPTLFTALQEQLGLKLSPAKGPVRLLVIDHIDKLPSDN